MVDHLEFGSETHVHQIQVVAWEGNPSAVDHHHMMDRDHLDVEAQSRIHQEEVHHHSHKQT